MLQRNDFISSVCGYNSMQGAAHIVKEYVHSFIPLRFRAKNWQKMRIRIADSHLHMIPTPQIKFMCKYE